MNGNSIVTNGFHPAKPLIEREHTNGHITHDNDANDSKNQLNGTKENQDLHELLTGSVLSDKNILSGMKLGYVHISPFSPNNLSTSSYDVTLGRNFFRETDYQCGQSIFNPYSKAHVERVWGTVQTAQNAGEWMQKMGQKLDGISSEDEIIWLKPSETILAHTKEFIGGMKCVTTMMKARSSWGRCFIEVCKCADKSKITSFIHKQYIALNIRI